MAEEIKFMFSREKTVPARPDAVENFIEHLHSIIENNRRFYCQLPDKKWTTSELHMDYLLRDSTSMRPLGFDAHSQDYLYGDCTSFTGRRGHRHDCLHLQLNVCLHSRRKCVELAVARRTENYSSCLNLRPSGRLVCAPIYP